MEDIFTSLNSIAPKSPFSPSNQMTSITTTLNYATTAKRLKRRHEAEEHHQSLLPGLPDDIAHLCLSLLPPSSLYSVCRSWRHLIYSPSFPPFPSLYALLISTENHPHLSDVQFASFDPLSAKWLSLPPPLRLLFRHPSFISRKLRIQSVAVSGKLVLLAATADQFSPALSHPLVFNPLSQKWSHGPPLSAPRRWCAAGVSGGAVYVASGIGLNYDNDVAKSVEKWDLNTHQDQRRRWNKMAKLRDAKFSREAIDAVGWKGKLCMVNVKGDAVKEGIIYDLETDSWEDMPEGMLAGWRGPAAAMAEETIYVVDESKGWLKKYNHINDAWVEVAENEMLKGAQQVVAAEGKVCVLCADGREIAVVDVAAARICTVDVPTGFEAVGIHVLPRLAHPDI